MPVTRFVSFFKNDIKSDVSILIFNSQKKKAVNYKHVSLFSLKKDDDES